MTEPIKIYTAASVTPRNPGEMTLAVELRYKSFFKHWSTYTAIEKTNIQAYHYAILKGLKLVTDNTKPVTVYCCSQANVQQIYNVLQEISEPAENAMDLIKQIIDGPIQAVIEFKPKAEIMRESVVFEVLSHAQQRRLNNDFPEHSLTGTK